MSNVVEITVDAQELVETVEERLAWLAIADQSTKLYDPNDIRRAECVVDIGRGTYGRLSVGKVSTAPLSFVRPNTGIEGLKGTYSKEIAAALPRLGQRMRFAMMHESSDAHGCNRWESLYSADQRRQPPKFWLKSCGVMTSTESAHFYVKHRRPDYISRATTVVLFQELSIMPDGSVSRMLVDAALTKEGQLLDPRSAAPLNALVHSDLLFFTALQFLRRQYWVIELSMTRDRTGIGLETDATGAREFTRMLGREQTRNGRRKSLVHWVNEHYRANRSGSTSLVRAHLRGTTHVRAGDFFAAVTPSRVDVERACNGSRYAGEQAP